MDTPAETRAGERPLAADGITVASRKSRDGSTGDVPGRASPLRRDRRALFVLLKRLEHQVANPVLGRRIDDRPEQGEAAAFAVDAVLARGERHISPTRRATPLP